MPFDIEDVTDRVSEFSDIASTGKISAADQADMTELGEKITRAMRAEVPTIEFKGSFDLSKTTTTWTIGDGTGVPEDVTVKSSKGKILSYGDAIVDPDASPASVTDAFKNACGDIGLSISSDVSEQMTERISNNPQRAINRVTSSISERAANPDIDGIKDALNNIDKRIEAATGELKKQLTDQANKMLEDAKVIKDQTASIDKINERFKSMSDAEKKSFAEKLKDGAWSVTKLLALIGAGILTYDAIKDYRNGLRGCWQSTSTGSSVSKGKVYALTCDDCCNSTGDSIALMTVCDPTAVQPGSPITPCVDCKGSPTCPIGSSCDHESNLCSVWCSNSVRVLKDRNGNTNAYQCNDPSFADTIADIASNVENAVTNLFGDLTSFLHNLLKYGLYAVVVVIALVLLYLAYKFISPIFSKHSDQDQSSHSGQKSLTW